MNTYWLKRTVWIHIYVYFFKKGNAQILFIIASTIQKGIMFKLWQLGKNMTGFANKWATILVCYLTTLKEKLILEERID